MSFYDKFCEACNANSLKPTRVVKELGLSSANMSNWKNGRLPKTEILNKIAKHLNVTTDFLLDKSDSATNVSSEHINIIKIAGRDGSYEERVLTDEQLELFKQMINAVPKATDL